MDKKFRVAVGLSGGVDSAVVAAMLHREGYEVVGLTMKIWRDGLPAAMPRVEGAKHGCYGPGEDEDIAVSERLCASLGIPYRVIDLSEDYERLVLDYFRREYRAGRTPNPCIVCNREMKFGFLLERARASGLDFDLFATGHYARIVEREGVHFLARAKFLAKDQSYFLYTLDSQLLSGVRFPLGELDKAQVRAEAKALGLEVAEKAESQDFVGGGDYAPLFADRPPEAGDFVDREGRVLGKHRGLPYYTIGQRRGLGISTGPEPLYVLRLEAATNRVVLGKGEGLFADGLVASSFRFQDPRHVASEFRGFAKVRLAHSPAACRVTPGEGNEVSLIFDKPERAIAPGQSAVIYDEEGLVLGGGIIERPLALAE
ncbi:MAG TPA: tRNA 2-thiouridine(34) synthase MnmA [Rectinemataceae bacterium]|nr:tRNA 2-thiouridine(34) synthase MnmA [Rectinemataceae bacterium]